MALRRTPPDSSFPAWAEGVRGDLARDEPMARHTSWRVGGPADWFFRPSDLQDLSDLLARLPVDVPVTWVGLGSNLLVRDGGLRGVVISPRPALTAFEERADGSLRVGAGIACARIARHAARAGQAPAAFFAGIPGTLGGALAMNAGAWGGETWDVVVEVETVDRQGVCHRRPASGYEVAYRHVAGRTHDITAEWFTAAVLAFPRDNESEDIRSLLVRRKQTQPLGQPSCGSVFRNPPGDHAARLIEACGLKGKRLGGAEVSTKHANFIINAGGALAADIEALVEEVRSTVADRMGVSLIAEVRIVGEASSS
ncbi:MAG: UDP-N-acetylmuramate dehydrogenase [Pseudomonadota bacterium]